MSSTSQAYIVLLLTLSIALLIRGCESSPVRSEPARLATADENAGTEADIPSIR